MKTISDAVNAPPLDAKADVLVDWLELVAFFDPNGVARMDTIDNAFVIMKEENSIDIAEEDADNEDRRSKIEEEVIFRSSSLTEAYPFSLSDDGEELVFNPRGSRSGACFYLLCLIVSHITRSPILAKPPTGSVIDDVRKRQFQVLATLAVAGHLGGPSLSFGWPRPNSEGITDAVDRCCRLSGTGKARIPPGPEASRFAKDGGMDVIAWKVAVNGYPPPAVMCFGQSASGHEWSTKSAFDELEQFLQSYFLDRPACSYTTVTVVPFRLNDRHQELYARRHGHILDRSRTPRAAMIGLRIATNNGVHVDEVDAVWKLNCRVLRYRHSLRAA
jgi:hypothetical protein